MSQTLKSGPRALHLLVTVEISLCFTVLNTKNQVSSKSAYCIKLTFPTPNVF